MSLSPLAPEGHMILSEAHNPQKWFAGSPIIIDVETIHVYIIRFNEQNGEQMISLLFLFLLFVFIFNPETAHQLIKPVATFFFVSAPFFLTGPGTCNST